MPKIMIRNKRLDEGIGRYLAMTGSINMRSRIINVVVRGKKLKISPRIMPAIRDSETGTIGLPVSHIYSLL